MKVEVYDQKNKKAGDMTLPEKFFGAKWNPELVHQAIVTQSANERVVLAHTKGRGDVRGGGKKPWAQKHTGRARHSSIRSPLWAGGGVTFGPTKERIFKKKINKKMKRAALFSVLSRKLADKEVWIIEDLSFENHKTKNLTAVLKVFFKEKLPSVLFVPAKANKKIFLAARNLPKVKVLNPEMLNIYDCLSHNYIVFEKAGVADLANHYSKEIKT